MIVDTSVVVAILRGEPDSREYVAALNSISPRRLSAGNYLELAIIIDKQRSEPASQRLDAFLAEMQIEIEPVTATQAKLARAAYRQFGKGSGHPAELHYGDCFAYALAKDKGEPLLFKGNDFAQTDIPYVGKRSDRRRLSELIATYG